MHPETRGLTVIQYRGLVLVAMSDDGLPDRGAGPARSDLLADGDAARPAPPAARAGVSRTRGRGRPAGDDGPDDAGRREGLGRHLGAAAGAHRARPRRGSRCRRTRAPPSTPSPTRSPGTAADGSGRQPRRPTIQACSEVGAHGRRPPPERLLTGRSVNGSIQTERSVNRRRRMAPQSRTEGEATKLASRARILPPHGPLRRARLLRLSRGGRRRRAGMSPGNVYWHFDSKEAILRAILAEGFGSRRGDDRRGRRSLRAGPSQAGPPRRANARPLRGNAEFIVILGGLMGHGGRDLIRSLGFDMPEIVGRYHANLRRVFAEARSEGALGLADPDLLVAFYLPSSMACSSPTPISGRRCRRTPCATRSCASWGTARPAEEAVDAPGG